MADEARLQSLFTEAVCRDGGRDLELLGEGTHFAAWRVRGPAGAAGGAGLDLVIKRAHRSFGGGPDRPGREAWRRALSSARAARDIPLLPPWVVLEAGDDLGLAMPFGPDPAAAAAPHWHPMPERRRELTARLAAAGLELADQLQLRSWRGVPFVIDLSDLRRSGPGSP